MVPVQIYKLISIASTSNGFDFKLIKTFNNIKVEKCKLNNETLFNNETHIIQIKPG